MTEQAKTNSHKTWPLRDVLPATPSLETGAVTAELATTLPAVMLLLTVVITLAAAFGTQFRVSDAARTGARLAAIGTDSAEIRSTIAQITGGHPEVSITNQGEWATVQVRKTLHIGPVFISPLAITSHATTWVEP